MTITIALQLLISGLSVGSIYAMVALALVIPFKASSILNFAQGEIVTVGAYAALVLTALGFALLDRTALHDCDWIYGRTRDRAHHHSTNHGRA